MEEKKPPQKPVYMSVIIMLIVLGVLYFFLAPSKDAVVPETTPATETTEEAPAATLDAVEQLTTVSPQNLMHTISIETNKGTVVFETYDVDAPETVKNFITLANKGYYNGVIFHRVIKNFMIQGGDPTGTGRGGPGYAFKDELNPDTQSYKDGYTRGTVAMANAGPNTNGSQFFIMHKDYPLPNSYTIFGKVVSGMDVVDAIAESAVDQSDKPVAAITMQKVTVAEKK